MPGRDDRGVRGAARDIRALTDGHAGLTNGVVGRGIHDTARSNQRPPCRSTGRGGLYPGRDAGRNRDHRVDHGLGGSPRAQLSWGIQSQGGQTPDRELRQLARPVLSRRWPVPDRERRSYGSGTETRQYDDLERTLSQDRRRADRSVGHIYVYRAPAERGPYEIVSLGSDGQEGGTGTAADISNDGAAASRP